MTGKYFDRFPLTEYGGQAVRNILAKVDLTEQSKKDIYTYYDFTLEEGLTRPDVLSDNYYDDPNFDWVFYLVNDVVDPYHSFYIENDDFDKYIIKKYGSKQTAEQTIVFYRNNWYLLDDSSISVDVYDSLSSKQQEYYAPVTNVGSSIIRYERHKDDWIRSTNAVVELTLGDVADYTVGDRITQASSSASATIRSIDTDNNILVVHHLSGSFVEGVLGDTSITNVNTIHTNISSPENNFWQPVTAYEFEQENNERKKQIFVLPSDYLAAFDGEFAQRIK